MSQADRTKSNDEIRHDLESGEDPAPVVNYTIGMIAAFIILALIAVFAISIFYSSSKNEGVTPAGQSEKRASP